MASPPGGLLRLPALWELSAHFSITLRNALAPVGSGSPLEAKRKKCPLGLVLESFHLLTHQPAALCGAHVTKDWENSALQ